VEGGGSDQETAHQWWSGNFSLCLGVYLQFGIQESLFYNDSTAANSLTDRSCGR